MNKLPFDEMKLTSYMLGELDESEMALVAQELARNPEAQAMLDELTETSSWLEAELLDLPTPELSDTNRETLLNQAAQQAESPTATASSKPTPAWTRRLLWPGFGVAAAALVLWFMPLNQDGPSPIHTGLEEEPEVSFEDSWEGEMPEADQTSSLSGQEITLELTESLPSSRSYQDFLDLAPSYAPKDSADISTNNPHPTTPLPQTPPSTAPTPENPFFNTLNDPLSTFSVDVDTASYTRMRAELNSGRLPHTQSLRIEELVNYFSYDDPEPVDGHPFSVTTEVSAAPWNPEHRLARIGLKGQSIQTNQRPACNLVFLLDVSGSMNASDKLGLLKSSFEVLVDNLTARDRVAIVTYAGMAGVVLDSTSGADKSTIMAAFEHIYAGGGTDGVQGIERAYEIAARHFIKGGVNRVILGTDGDFNVGQTGTQDLNHMISQKAESGVFLSVLGFGLDHNDEIMKTLAQNGNGHYSFIDSHKEANRALSEQLNSTLVTIAKDVKIQVEFNPLLVQGYRLIGYETRILNHQDFDNDAIDAGDIGAGHDVTALYEIIPVDADGNQLAQEIPLKYQELNTATIAAEGDELLTVNLRYKLPNSNVSTYLEVPLSESHQTLAAASDDLKFATAVAAFGMILRKSAHTGDFQLEDVLDLARESVAAHEDRREFLSLVERAKSLRQ